MTGVSLVVSLVGLLSIVRHGCGAAWAGVAVLARVVRASSQVDRINVQPSSEADEKLRQLRLAQRTLSGGFGNTGSNASPSQEPRAKVRSCCDGLAGCQHAARVARIYSTTHLGKPLLLLTSASSTHLGHSRC